MTDKAQDPQFIDRYRWLKLGLQSTRPEPHASWCASHYALSCDCGRDYENTCAKLQGEKYKQELDALIRAFPWLKDVEV